MKLTIINNSDKCKDIYNSFSKFQSSEQEKGQESQVYKINIGYHNKANEDVNFFKDPILTYTDLWNIQTSDAIVIFGTWGSVDQNRIWHPTNNKRRQAWLNNTVEFFVNVAKSYGVRVIVLETGTLCRSRGAFSEGHWKTKSPRYYRMGLDHWVYGLGKFINSKGRRERLDTFVKEFQNKNFQNAINQFEWKNNKEGKIVILTGLENDPTSTMLIPDFVKYCVTEIRKHTNRPIALKSHPYSKYEPDKELGLEIISKGLLLKDIASDMYCAVLDNSTSIFELISLGIPAFTQKHNFGYNLGNNDLSKINDIHYATKEVIDHWFVEMSWTEFTEAEFKSPVIFTYIKELLDE